MDGKIVEDPSKIPSLFNDFFVNVGPSTENSIPHVPPDKLPPENFLKNRNHLSFTIANISTEEIYEIIKSPDINKSTGPMSIPVKLL